MSSWYLPPHPAAPVSVAAGQLLLDSSNPHARLDAETNLLKKFANAIIHLMLSCALP
jgi:hypothetical protein